MKPKVSVILPTYNMAKYLPHSLSSVFKQTQENIELILIDDGSTDNTKATVDRFRDLYKRDDISFLNFDQENQGRSVALNNGIEYASAPLVTFLDADDSLPRKSLENRCKKLKSSADADAVIGNMKIFHEEIGIIENRKPIDLPMEYWPILYLRKGIMPAPHITLMFRTEKLDGIRFDPNLRRSQDIDFSYKVFTRLKVAHIDKIVYNYERRPISYSRKLRKRLSTFKNGFYLINKYHPKEGKYSAYAKNLIVGGLKVLYETALLNRVIEPGLISRKVLRRKKIKNIYKVPIMDAINQ